jgi:hypothetical protein
MRLIRSAIVVASALSVALLGGALPAAAAGSMPLRWDSPNKVTSGRPFDVTSIAPCPPLPNPGDQLLVGIGITFTGGSMGDVLSANPDGSWSGTLTFTFTSAPRQASFSADCEDFNGIFATSYAQYQTHHVQLFSS